MNYKVGANLSSVHEEQSDASLKMPVDSRQQCYTVPLHCTCRTLIRTSWELSLGVPSVPSRGRQVGDRESPSCSCLLAESQVSPSKIPTPLRTPVRSDAAEVAAGVSFNCDGNAHVVQGETSP